MTGRVGDGIGPDSPGPTIALFMGASRGEPGPTAYATNPTWFVPDLRGDHLEWLRARLHVVLTVGQGQWEDTTGAMASTVHMAGLLRDQGVRVDLDMWGHDVAHDWPWWQRQACHHVPRFCCCLLYTSRCV